jgi:hypothetical protein
MKLLKLAPDDFRGLGSLNGLCVFGPLRISELEEMFADVR